MKIKNPSFRNSKTKNSVKDYDTEDFEEANDVQKKWFEQVRY